MNEFHSTFSWWAEIWIPAIGAIVIPISIVFFTWFFGASRAEKQKELETLRNNLNFLISVSLTSINSLNFLSEKIKGIYHKEREALAIQEKEYTFLQDLNIDEICYGFVFDNIYKNIDLEKYSDCVIYDKEFIKNLTLIKSLMNATDTYISERNKILLSISDSENPALKSNRYTNFIISDNKNIAQLLYDVCRIALLLKITLDTIAKIASLNKSLKLINIEYMQNEIDFLQEADHVLSIKDKIFSNQGIE